MVKVGDPIFVLQKGESVLCCSLNAELTSIFFFVSFVLLVQLQFYYLNNERIRCCMVSVYRSFCYCCIFILTITLYVLKLISLRWLNQQKK